MHIKVHISNIQKNIKNIKSNTCALLFLTKYFSPKTVKCSIFFLFIQRFSNQAFIQEKCPYVLQYLKTSMIHKHLDLFYYVQWWLSSKSFKMTIHVHVCHLMVS